MLTATARAQHDAGSQASSGRDGAMLHAVTQRLGHRSGLWTRLGRLVGVGSGPTAVERGGGAGGAVSGS